MSKQPTPDPGLYGIPRPPLPFSAAILEVAKRHGDQPLSSTEVDLGGGVSMVLGVRNAYFRVGGHWVLVVPGQAVDVTVPPE